MSRKTRIGRLRICYLLRKLGCSSKVFPPELRGFRSFAPEIVAEAIEGAAEPGTGCTSLL